MSERNDEQVLPRVTLLILVLLILLSGVGFEIQYHRIRDLQRRVAELEQRR